MILNETLESQVKRLADVIMAEIPGEPSRSEGAVDTAIRLLRQALPEAAKLKSVRHQWKNFTGHKPEIRSGGGGHKRSFAVLDRLLTEK